MSATPNLPTDPWRALRDLLDQRSPAVIATAIEQHGVWVYDRFNRRVKASTDTNDEYSQARALDLVAEWQAELSDPGPKYSWDDERFELEGHPTQQFGWPESRLPNLSACVKAVNPKSTNTPKTTKTKDEWIQVAQQEALVILKNERRQGLDPKQDALAKDVAKVLQDKSVRTIRGAITSENIMREALAGDWWRNTRQRPI
jgi:hypothetical protein